MPAPLGRQFVNPGKNQRRHEAERKHEHREPDASIMYSERRKQDAGIFGQKPCYSQASYANEGVQNSVSI